MPNPMFNPLTDEERADTPVYNAVSKAQTTWCPILPIPSDVPKVKPHPRLGRPSSWWCYRDHDGQCLGYICRFDSSDGGKVILPLTYCEAPDGRREWQWKAFTFPRPLYGLDRLATLPAAPVIVAEGEKTADAAAALFTDWVAVTSPGGGKAAEKTDWTPLQGRYVTVWPDHDVTGTSYAKDVARFAQAAGAATLSVVNVPANFPKGWDLADVPPEGWNPGQLRGLLTEAPKWEPQTTPTDADALLTELAALSPLEYEPQREEVAKQLNIRVSVLDEEVSKRRPMVGSDGEGLGLVDPIPWDAPVNGAELIQRIIEELQRYIVMPPHIAEAVALWVIHTYAFEFWRHTPRLAVRAADKGSGKSTMLDVLACVVRRAVKADSISTAVLFRVVDQYHPTMLIDEVDSFLRDNEELRGALNAGHSRMGKHFGSIRESYVFVIECLERQEVGSWTARVSRCGFRRRAG